MSLVVQLYLTGAVYSLDGSDSLKETMQATLSAVNTVSTLRSLHPPHILITSHLVHWRH
jgi:hypothetical protein